MLDKKNNQDFYNSTFLITGGTGSWGQEVTRQLLEKYHPKEIRIFSRSEFNQVKMARKFTDQRLKFIIGDVKSLNRLTDSMKGVDIVFHLAALKHIPVCEDNPWESISVNVAGVENVIRAAISNEVKVVIDSSSDKACSPLNLYGMCKSVGERLIINANKRLNNLTTKFVCVRAGNVIATNGSVIPYFIERIMANKSLPITHQEMTRYFMDIRDAIGLLFKAAQSSVAGEIYVTKMPACRIVDLAKALLKHFGKDLPIEFTGIRNGEKLAEMLVSENESAYTVEDDDFRIILPMDGSLNQAYAKYPKMKEKSYSSSDQLINEDEILALLKKAGCI